MMRRMIGAVLMLAVTVVILATQTGCPKKEGESVRQHEQTYRSEPREVIE